MLGYLSVDSIRSKKRTVFLKLKSINVLVGDYKSRVRENIWWIIKQLWDEVEHDIMNYQNRGLCYLPTPKAEADNTDTRFW